MAKKNQFSEVQCNLIRQFTIAFDALKIRVLNEMGLDVSQAKILFDLKGYCAGKVEYKSEANSTPRLYKFTSTTTLKQNVLSTLEMRINVSALEKDYNQMVSDVLPHEMAHVICALYPQLGKNHDSRWEGLARRLGGSGKLRHSISLNSANREWKYHVAGEDVVLTTIRHNKLQNGKVDSYQLITKSGDHHNILKEHYVP